MRYRRNTKPEIQRHRRTEGTEETMKQRHRDTRGQRRQTHKIEGCGWTEDAYVGHTRVQRKK